VANWLNECASDRDPGFDRTLFLRSRQMRSVQRSAFFVMSGERVPTVTAGHTKELAEEARPNSNSPVPYANLSGGQHCLDCSSIYPVPRRR
jgi:hypothetical protein